MSSGTNSSHIPLHVDLRPARLSGSRRRASTFSQLGGSTTPAPGWHSRWSQPLLWGGAPCERCCSPVYARARAGRSLYRRTAHGGPDRGASGTRTREAAARTSRSPSGPALVPAAPRMSAERRLSVNLPTRCRAGLDGLPDVRAQQIAEPGVQVGVGGDEQLVHHNLSPARQLSSPIACHGDESTLALGIRLRRLPSWRPPT
jgi:hypothetical protein